MSPRPTEAERLARVALNRLGEPGDLRMTSLTVELGAIEFHRRLLQPAVDGPLQADVAARLGGLDPARELEQAARAGLRFVVPGDAEWPTQLDDLAAAGSLHERGGVPIGLWIRGTVPLPEAASAVAIVGSRAATTYGASVAADIGAVVTLGGRTVVSGGAFGIDVAAHRGAMSRDRPTVAVLACGADRVYPQAHRAILDHVAATGAVVSEAAPGCSPLRIRFLARNRLIAALAAGTVVVEAAVRSGALNTASWASRLNRVLMGVPGPVTSGGSAGVHTQIRQGSMALVTGGADVLELLGRSGEHLLADERSPDGPRDVLTIRQRQVLDAVPVGTSATADSIARTGGVAVRDVGPALAALDDAGLVEHTAGGWRLTGAART